MLTGTASVEELVPQRATLDSFASGEVVLPDVTILQALFELRVDGRQRSLPSGLHPTNPPTFVVQVWTCPQSPWGAFRMAQARVGCRSGLRPRGFVQGAVVDNPTAVDALRSRWGYPAVPGDVQLHRGYDIVRGSARAAGHQLLDLAGGDPEPLVPSDVAYTSTVALAETPRGTRLVQIDTDVHPLEVHRLRPRLDAFRTGGSHGWVHPSVTPWYPVSASIATAELTIQRLRYACKPEELAFSGTETVGDSAGGTG